MLNVGHPSLCRKKEKKVVSMLHVTMKKLLVYTRHAIYIMSSQWPKMAKNYMVLLFFASLNG